MQGRVKEFSVKEEALSKTLVAEGFSVWAASRAVLSVKYGSSGGMDWMGGEDGEEGRRRGGEEEEIWMGGGEEEILGAARGWLFGHLGQEGVNPKP